MRPHVSFVTFGRNDDYTPDFAQRFEKVVSTLAAQLDRARVESEIVIVEWNPPAGRPLLLDLLAGQQRHDFVSIKGYVVGANFHAGFEGSQERGMHAGECWNVGIRRARGRFVTPKASDTFFSPQLIELIAQRDLRSDEMYRADRYDVAVPADFWSADGEAWIAQLDSLPAERNAYLRQMDYWQLRDLHSNACGDFLLMASEVWHRLRGHPLDKSVLMLDGDSLVLHAAAGLGIRERRWAPPAKIYKPSRANLNNARITTVWQQWQRVLEALLKRVGGPALAHQARMHFDYPRRRIRGIDSVLGPSIERNFVRPASLWAKGVRPEPTQPANWGLADETLEERVVWKAAWDD